MNICLWHRATIIFARDFFALSEDEAEKRMEVWWQKRDIISVTSSHPFFAAGDLAGCEILAISKKYLVHLREIDEIWPAQD